VAYATYSDVQARLGGRFAFGAATKPTQAQVTAWIAEAEAVLNGTLQAAELEAPYSSDAAVLILRNWVTSYVEGLVRQVNAAAGGDGGNDDGKDLIEAWEQRLRDVATRPSWYGAMLGAGNAPDAARRIRGYVLDNDDDKTIADGHFAPTFTRDETF
jgi:hypothetical protein